MIDSVEKYRLQLNKIDKAIFLLCKKRVRIAMKISNVKLKSKINLLDVKRELEIKDIFYKKVKKMIEKKRANEFVESLIRLNPYYPIVKKRRTVK